MRFGLHLAPILLSASVAILLHAVFKNLSLTRSSTLPLNRRHCRACSGVLINEKDHTVKFQILFASVVATSIALPVAAEAQGVPGGVAHGMYEGNRRAGPVGAIVGGAVGGVIGGVEGVLGITPAYGTYSEPPPRVFYHRKRVKHSYRRIRHRQAAR
jgi:hypothetical protein